MNITTSFFNISKLGTNKSQIRLGEAGFTLAELLIALAILGVIATFTIPKVLNSSQDEAYNSIAKEVSGMISEAYQSYQIANAVDADTAVTDLTPYLNYVSFETSGSIDNWYGATTLVCSVNHPCLRLHNGAVIRYKKAAAQSGFGGVASNNAVLVWLDPDGEVTTGATTGAGKSVGFYLYFNGRFSDKGNIVNPTVTEFTTYTPNSANNPPWFSW